MNKYYLLDLINKIKDIDGNTYFSSSYVTKHIFKIDKKELRINKIKTILILIKLYHKN